MRRRVSLKRAAKHDIGEHAYYIAVDNLDAAERFLGAVDRVLGELAEMPGMGRPCELGHVALRGVRALQVPGFRRYLVFYRETADGLNVIRVLHSARDIERVLGDDPEAWC